MTKNLQYRLEDDENTKIIFLSGPLNENASEALEKILKEKKSSLVAFDFSDLEYVNSLGLRIWVNFFNTFREGKSIVFRNCTSDVIMQINMVASFSKGANIESFLGDFMCDSCDFETSIKFDTILGKEALIESFQGRACRECSDGTLELEADEDSYLEFMNED